MFADMMEQKYTNLGFLAPLVDAMTQLQPSDRPKARQAMQIFENIESKLRGPTLRWRLRSVSGPMGARVANDVVSYLRELKVLCMCNLSAFPDLEASDWFNCLQCYLQ